MSMMDSLRKGLRLFLLSMGVSAPAKKPRLEKKPAAKDESGKR